MNNILIICGPTATGKTSLALKLAKKLNGELISADSRQVYRGMDINTGKDIPKQFKYQVSRIKYQGKRIAFYGNSTKIWGYDLVNPTEEFSVSHFTQITWIIIKHLWKQSKLPIIVGGTGLYLSSLLKPPRSLHVPVNRKLRNHLSSLGVSSLQQELERVHPKRFSQMNQSDKNNPRRLIRAIEVAFANTRSQNSNYFDAAKYRSKVMKGNMEGKQVLWIGLKTSIKELDNRIDLRVEKRVDQGIDHEVKKLKSLLKKHQLPAASAIGYTQWLGYLEGGLSRKQAIKKWQTAEHQYARRQLTWFKKQPKINWFDITQFDFNKKVVEVAKTWYAINK